MPSVISKVGNEKKADCAGKNMDQIDKKQNRLYHINASHVGYWLFLVFLTLPHINPDYLQQIPLWEFFLNGWRLVSFIVIAFWVFFIRKKMSLVLALIGIYEFFIIVTTAIHHGETYGATMDAFSVLSITMLYDVSYTKNDRTFLSSQLFCFELVTYINLYTIFAFPGGMYSVPPEYYTKNWFLGYYNTYTRYFVPALMFAWLYKEKTGKRLRVYFLATAIVVTVFKVWSGGEIMLLLSMFLVYLFFKNRTGLFNYYSYWILQIVFLVGVLVFRVQNLFRWFIDDFLGKWGSLTSRISLWEKTLQFFLKFPIMGHGIQDSFTVRRSEYGSIAGAHAHNLLLELLYRGGIIGIILWGTIVIIAGKTLYKYRETPESKIIATAFLGWCIATLVEPFTMPFLMGMFVIAYRSNREESLTQEKIAKTEYRVKPYGKRSLRDRLR